MPPTAAPAERNPLDPRARRTRQLLVDAFRELMRDRSYGRITVGDIAVRATVNRATFYLHFRDKDALLDYSLDSMTREALEQSAPLPPRWDLGYLELLLAGACDFLTRLDRECPRAHKVFEVRLETQLQLDVRARVAAWLALPDAPTTSRQAALTATLLGAAVCAAARAWRQQERRPPARTFAHDTIPALLAPLGAPPRPMPARPMRIEPRRTIRSAR